MKLDLSFCKLDAHLNTGNIIFITNLISPKLQYGHYSISWRINRYLNNWRILAAYEVKVEVELEPYKYFDVVCHVLWWQDNLYVLPYLQFTHASFFHLKKKWVFSKTNCSYSPFLMNMYVSRIPIRMVSWFLEWQVCKPLYEIWVSTTSKMISM